VGRDPEYLRVIRPVADARAAAAPSSIEAAREDFHRSMRHAPRPPMSSAEDLEVPGGDGPVRARLLAFLAWSTFARRPAEAIAQFGAAVRSVLVR
jgi:hypothetical protein